MTRGNCATMLRSTKSSGLRETVITRPHTQAVRRRGRESSAARRAMF